MPAPPARRRSAEQLSQIMRAGEERLRHRRRWAAWSGVAAAALPLLVAMGAAGWGFLDVLMVGLELPRLPGGPLKVAAAALLATGAAACMASTAPSRAALLATLGGGFAGGVLAVFAARELPVYRAGRGALLADGSSMAGAIVRVEHLWPTAPDRLHVLRGNGRVERGAVLTIQGGRAVAYLRGG
jgi:hypothetical protein